MYIKGIYRYTSKETRKIIDEVLKQLTKRSK